MGAVDEFVTLVRAVGEYTVGTLGKENLTGLRVDADRRESSAFITIALADPSNAAQRSAIETMFEVEALYADEISLTYIFVDRLDEAVAVSSALQYSYA